MSIREELILKVLAKEDTVVDLAEEYDVARKTIYKWLKRYEKRVVDGARQRVAAPEQLADEDVSRARARSCSSRRST